jgi:DNA sulfur modification protein DndD
LIEDVKIDPETFELQLFGREGRKIDPSDLSAGERQLTALSLLWGLARASERPLPLIIDTPLGRLDSTHRQLLLERYLPKASHQVIVLSTDTEVDAEALDELGESVGRTYRLVHSNERQSTTVEPGYFFDGLEVAA